MLTIRQSTEADLAPMLAIINDAAQAYRGVIPADRWHEPYMSAADLSAEATAGGIAFWVAEQDERLMGLIGIQSKGDVALVRHAYVASNTQRSGVGTRLLRHVLSLATRPVLIGTWAAASWAIDFYRRNGFTVVSEDEKNRLLRAYWSIPERQVETSVVLADARWMHQAAESGLRMVVAEWDHAMEGNDADKIGRYMADDWIIIGSDGIVSGKQEFLGFVRSGVLRHDVMESHDMDVRVYGDAAVVVARGISGGAFHGRPFYLTERASSVFVRRAGEWLCVSTHLSLMSGGGA